MDIDFKEKTILGNVTERGLKTTIKKVQKWSAKNRDYMESILSIGALSDMYENNFNKMKDYPTIYENVTFTGLNDKCFISPKDGKEYKINRLIFVIDGMECIDGSFFGHLPTGNSDSGRTFIQHFVNTYGKNITKTTERAEYTSYQIYMIEPVKQEEFKKLELTNSFNPHNLDMGIISGKIVSIKPYVEKIYENRVKIDETICQFINVKRNQLVMSIGIRLTTPGDSLKYFTTINVAYQQIGSITWLGFDTKPLKELLNDLACKDEYTEKKNEQLLLKQQSLCQDLLIGKFIQTVGFFSSKENTFENSEIDYNLYVDPTLIQFIEQTSSLKQSTLDIVEETTPKSGKLHPYTKKLEKTIDKGGDFIFPPVDFPLPDDQELIIKIIDELQTELAIILFEDGCIYERAPGKYMCHENGDVTKLDDKIRIIYNNIEKKCKSLDLEKLAKVDLKGVLKSYYTTNTNPPMNQIKEFLEANNIKVTDEMIMEVIKELNAENEMNNMI